MATAGTTVYTKTKEELEDEFKTNKESNAKPNQESEAASRRLPENMVEYFEQLVIENIRSIKLLEKENIPKEIKAYRRQYLEKQQNMLLDQLDELSA